MFLPKAETEQLYYCQRNQITQDTE
jgi:hypothetical protein